VCSPDPLQGPLPSPARHGDGSAKLELTFGPSALELVVSNPLGDDRSARGGGHGIVGVRERAALLGGTVEAGARGERFELRARLPLAT